jgi:thioredoxin-related protein
MKKAALPTLLMLIIFFVNAALYAETLSEAKRKARNEGKATVLYFFSKHCSYCRAMDHDVFDDKEISDTLKKDVVYLRIDVDKSPGAARTCGVWAYPTTLLLESTGKRITQIPGYVSKSDFRKILSYLKGKRYKTMGLGDFLGAGDRQ